MRQVLISIAGTALGALIFMLVLFLSILGYTAYTDKQRAVTSDPSLVARPAGLRITRHSLVDDVDKFTVIGVLENSGTSQWYAPRIIIDISASGKSISECETTIFGKVLPGAKHPFQISCDETSRDLPFPVTYKIAVREARRVDG
jgi:hypothetical protein